MGTVIKEYSLEILKKNTNLEKEEITFNIFKINIIEKQCLHIYVEIININNIFIYKDITLNIYIIYI